MAGFSKLGNMAKVKQCVEFFGELAELAIALVLKTRVRKDMGDRDPHSPPIKDAHSNVKKWFSWFDSSINAS